MSSFEPQQLLPVISSRGSHHTEVGTSSADTDAAVDDEQVLSLARQYPLANNTNISVLQYSYGTAGFRYKADLLEGVMLRVGMAASLMPTTSSSVSLGVMITASHNDESYNGVKYSAADGGMMGPDDETLAVEIVNTNRPQDLLDLIRLKRRQVTSTASALHIGRDTRLHSLPFSEVVIQGALAANPNITIVNHGIVTTPMLHHAVMHANYWQQGALLPALVPPRHNVVGYLQLLAHSYQALLGTGDDAHQQEQDRPPLMVDCACGVGYAALQGFRDCLQSMGGCSNRFVAMNPPGAGPLNMGCGSEHVQKSLQPPTCYAVAGDATRQVSSSPSYCCSFDGDADRIVFFSREPFYLLDGDKMATLICSFIRQQLDALQAPTIRLGVVQTAYANGASTKYLRRIMGHDAVAIAKTGVKYVHAAAHQFDIGVYFEANGHGTVVFGEAFYDYVATCKPSNAAARVALARLRILPSLINQAVGDALSDMLLIDAILGLQKLSIQEWNSMYEDLPSRQLKVLVKDRSIIKVNDNETKCLAPVQVQAELDKAMQTFSGRAFVRPSGTEDVVRVYAEAPTRHAADELADAAVQIVRRLCGGIDATPSSKL